MKSISLLFEFANEQGIKEPLFFTEPNKIIVAYHQEEVLSKLTEVQKAVDDGYYAAGYVSYEAAPAFDEAYRVKSETQMPLVWFGIFEKPIAFEEPKKGTFQLTDWKIQNFKRKLRSWFDKN